MYIVVPNTYELNLDHDYINFIFGYKLQYNFS